MNNATRPKIHVIAFPVELEEKEVLTDRCSGCFRLKEVSYCVEKTHEWICKSCASSPSVITLSPHQTRVYLSAKRHLKEYFISQAIAKDTGLSFSSIQTALTRLKKKGVFPDGRRRIHGYKIPSNTGTIIATENQYKVWKAATSPESLRSSNYVKLAAVATGVSTVSCQATIKKLRDKGVNIPTQQERCKNQLIYLKKRIWSEGLSSNQLLSPEVCESVGVTQYAMRCLITEIRKQGVVVFSESLALEIKQSLPLGTFSRHYINCTLKRPRSSIQQALNSLVVRGFIECLNPEAAPSKRVYKRV